VPRYARFILPALLVPLLLLPGCRGRDFANENDILRARVMELEDELAEAVRRNAELRAELASVAAVPASLSEAVRASTPHVTDIAIGPLSHLRDENRDGAIDTCIAYVSPSDALGRFVQMVGELSVHVGLLPADRDAITIGRAALSPAQLRAAYRSGMTGTHYTIAVPVVLPDDAGAYRECVVHVVYIDGRTARRLEAHRVIRLR